MNLRSIVGSLGLVVLLAGCGAVQDAGNLLGMGRESPKYLPPPTNPPLSLPPDRNELPQPAARAGEGASASAGAARAILGRAGEEAARSEGGN
jgi:hypothetical protein